ncbi:MAG: NAD(P)/FAD-dependent oxidoreductase [Eubacteriales bacterium]|nr:NAD(P)/FAD-dependent oxidoreductase [Eubacteriales bacterium]
MSKVLIIGGGASGMMAAAHAAKNGHNVEVFEKNEKLGKKLFITGKGRCNVTNNCETEDLFHAVMRNPKFLYSSFYAYGPQDVMHFFEEAGIRLKTERGNRVFPVSDHSSDIIRGLTDTMKKCGVKIHLNTEVKELIIENSQVNGIILTDDTSVYGDYVFIATGGISYPSTGSTGDGYRWAAAMGLKIVEPMPSLVPFYTKESYISKMQGLSLRNVALKIKDGKKVLYDDFGEMMFTHFGVTGPLVLSASAKIGDKLKKKELNAFIDLKPALTEEQLEARILREFQSGLNKQLKNVISVLYPSSLTPVLLELTGIDPEKPIHEISKQERRKIIELTKAFPFTITELGEFREAIITKGGVSVKEIDPGTMEAKNIKGLHFIGEVLDLDAVTGGFNLQIAWSTAYMAASAIK